jgi:hypothetical protein
MSEPKPVFISYAHTDNESSDPSKRWLDRVRQHLEPLVQQDNITICSDEEIGLGDDWHENIQAHLNGARAAVLLVSPAFLASEYIRNNELPVLLRKAKEHGVRIIPVVLRPCLFTETKFRYPDPKKGPKEFTLASIQAVGSPTKALSEMTEGEQDRALLSVARSLAKLVSENPPIALDQHVSPRGATNESGDESVWVGLWRILGSKWSLVIIGVTGLVLLFAAIGWLLLSPTDRRSLLQLLRLWPQPYSDVWPDDFNLDSNLTRWHYPKNHWKLVKGEGGEPTDGAVLVTSDVLGIPNNIGERAFYDFDLIFRARFNRGNRISWACRVQRDRQGKYVFELEKRYSKLLLTGYRYPGRKLIREEHVVNIQECCKVNDGIQVTTIARLNKFEISVKLVAFDPSDNRKDIGIEYKAGSIEDSHLPFGNVGLLETDPAAAMLVDYFRVIPK